ncbi:hypothetical protein GCM10010349_06750 [Streptomyces flavofungini]|nr:hypothetical protein GCM10010349_06750 [Streptomyces flavofungini]
MLARTFRRRSTAARSAFGTGRSKVTDTGMPTPTRCPSATFTRTPPRRSAAGSTTGFARGEGVPAEAGFRSSSVGAADPLSPPTEQPARTPAQSTAAAAPRTT